MEDDIYLVDGFEEREVKEMFRFLDNLRESGVTNMWGAVPYMRKAFPLHKEGLGKVHTKWMETFSQRHAAT